MQSRAATTADLDLLAEMNLGLLQDEKHRIPRDLPALRARMAGWFETGAWRMELFEADGEVIGYATYRREREPDEPDGERLSLRQFYIRPEHRRRGLGRRAMRHLIERRGHPGLPVRLEVLESNPEGRAFWTALGFDAYSTTMEWRPPRG